MFYYCLFPILKKAYYFYYFLGIVSYLRDSSIQYLEVKFDSKQSFNDHVRFINNKASAKIRFQSQRSFNQLFSLFLEVKKIASIVMNSYVWYSIFIAMLFSHLRSNCFLKSYVNNDHDNNFDQS